MASIRHGRHLWRPSQTLCQEARMPGLRRFRRLAGRMSSGHLVCSNLDLLLSGTLLRPGRKIKCGRSWLAVSSCTTWSSRALRRPSVWHWTILQAGSSSRSWSPATGNLDCLSQYASGDPRPTGASKTAARSGGAPMEAQGQRLARCVMKYEFLFVELYNVYWTICCCTILLNYLILIDFLWWTTS